MELSNSLSLIETRLISLESSNKVHPLFDTLVTFDYTFETHNSLFGSIFEDSINMILQLIITVKILDIKNDRKVAYYISFK